ncbi:MAG: outer membrane beta-barrel protein, partial [Bacteroidota bacterium]
LLYPDSSLATGTVFYDGELLLPYTEEGAFLLRVTALGREDHYQPLAIVLATAGVAVNDITLRPQLLATATVTAARKAVERRGTDLIVRVAGTALSNAGSANDLLRNAPGLSQDRTGAISVLGKGAATVYVDGQRVNSPGILGNLSSLDVQRVEVLRDPPARYEAAGNAVINIITRQYSLAGYKVNLTQEVGIGQHFRSTSRADGYYQLGDLLLQGSYGYRDWTFGGYLAQDRRFADGDDASRTINQYFLRNARKMHDYDLRLVHRPRANRTLRLQYTGSTFRDEKLGDNQRTLFPEGNPVLGIRSDVTGPTRQRTNAVNLGYTLGLDSLGSEVHLSGQYANFGFNRNERIFQTFPATPANPALERFSGNRNAISVYTLQADYRKEWSGGTRLETGLKAAMVNNRSSAELAEPGANGTRALLPAFTNDYDYEESVQAAYLSLTTKLRAWDLTTGLRAEATQSEGRSGVGEETPLFSRSYVDLFPSLSLARALSEQTSVRFGYNYRIGRPVFQDLNPYVLYVDSLVSLRGNPALLPEYAHSLSLGLDHKDWNLAFSYVHTRNKINQIFRSLDPANPNIIAFVKENLDFIRLYSATLSRPYAFKSISGFVSLGVFYDDHRIPDLGNRQAVNAQFGYNLQLNTQVSLPAELTFAGFANFTSRKVDGPYLDNPISFVNLSLSRRFFKDQLQVTLWTNDVFDRFWFRGTTEFNKMQASYISRGDWRFTKIALRWNFGKLQAGNTNGRSSRSELNRINQNQ